MQYKEKTFWFKDSSLHKVVQNLLWCYFGFISNSIYIIIWLSSYSIIFIYLSAGKAKSPFIHYGANQSNVNGFKIMQLDEKKKSKNTL